MDLSLTTISQNDGYSIFLKQLRGINLYIPVLGIHRGENHSINHPHACVFIYSICDEDVRIEMIAI